MVQSMGPGTCQIPLELYDLNRNRLTEKLRALDYDNAVVVLQGGQEISHYDTGVKYAFRQESFFLWAFGVTEPGCYGIIEVKGSIAHLFYPPEEPGFWKQPSRSSDYFIKKYMVNLAHPTTNLSSVLRQLEPSMLLTLKGVNSENGARTLEAEFPGRENFQVKSDVLYPVISDLRVYKTYYEYEVMKYVIEVTSFAHKRVMRVAKPERTEYLCECEFLNYIYGAAGCRHVSDLCVCASGKNTSYLEYGQSSAPNNNNIAHGVLCLFDMGASYFGYCAGVTCTFPANGKFSKMQKIIYEAVLSVNKQVIRQSKPGVSVVDLHTLSNKILLEELVEAGLLHGEPSEMLECGVASIFQPHGIGHFIGLDLYDVGGYLEGFPPRPQQDDGYRSLRTARRLEEGMFLSICPGCYFIDALLDRALVDSKLSRFLDEKAIEPFRELGGVRIEDNVYIHSVGAVVLSKVPRTVEQIEDWLAGIDDFDFLPSTLERKVSSVRFFT